MTQKVKNVPIKPWIDVWVAVIALTAITLVGARLWATEWTDDLYILVYLTFFAGVAGIALGYSRFSPLIVALFSTVYGLFTFGWLFGTTVEMEMTWRDRVFNYLVWRLRIAIDQFIAGQSLTDPILFLSLMAVMLWILGISAAFILIRQRSAWPSVIPLGITLLIIGHYDQVLVRNTRFLMSFLLLTLLIVGRMTFLRYRQKWREEGIQTTTETHADFNKTLVILASAMLLLAWIIPVSPQQVNRYSTLWDTLTEPWDRLSEQMSDIFVIDADRRNLLTGYFGETMTLGSGTPASEETVLIIEVNTDPPAGYRNYWRARSYDKYNHADWSTGSEFQETRLFPDNFKIQYPPWMSGEEASYTFTTLNTMINLYTTGEPLWVNRPVEALTQNISDTEEDLIALIADPELSGEETYQLTTQVRLPTATDLRNTSTIYPDWLERYLQLPADFSPEIAALAAEITRPFDNPFDKTYAITRYLRINIEYSRTIPSIPAGADPIEWFLFDGQVGFCNYYATAQVLMLRSLGIPARMGVGYAQGEYDLQSGTYTVRKRDSHAWPEVYFVDHGWVVFEPTVSQPALILPAGRGPLESDPSTGLLEDLPMMDEPVEEPAPMEDFSTTDPRPAAQQPFFRLDGSRIIWTMLAFFLIALVSTVFVLLRPTYFKINIDPLPVLIERTLKKHGKNVPDWLHRWSTIAQMSAAERAYRQMGRSIRLLGQPLNLAETPAERAKTLTGLLPTAEQPALDIINEYYLDKFSNHIINEERAKTAASQVRELALRARLRKFFSFTKR